MQAPGLNAYAARQPERTGVYAFENVPRELSAEYEQTLRANKKAWKLFEEQPPYVRRTSGFWVMSAKREETRLVRLSKLIASSENGVRVGLLATKPK